MFKNGIHICFNFFPLYLKANMEKTLGKVTKDPKRQERGKKITQDVHEEAKRRNPKG